MGMTRSQLRRHLSKHGYDVGQSSQLEDQFAAILDLHNVPEPEREYRFCERRWRFDFCWPDQNQKVAVELQGGTWSGGRHVRGHGYANDCDKLNYAQLDGYTVLQFTADQVRKTPEVCVGMLREALER